RGDEDAAEDVVAALQAEEGEQDAADDGADEPEQGVGDQPALALHDRARQPPRGEAHDDPADDAGHLDGHAAPPSVAYPGRPCFMGGLKHRWAGWGTGSPGP